MVHDESVTHTRLLKDIADDLKVIQLQNDLEKLDREWRSDLEKFMVTGKNGHRSVPSGVGSTIMGVVVIVFGVFWMIASSSMGAPGIFPLFGLVFIGIAIFGIMSGNVKAGRHAQAKAEFDRRRAELEAELEAAKQVS